MLGVSTLITVSVSIFSEHWDMSSLAPGLNITNGHGWRSVELIQSEFVLLYKDGALLSEEVWINNPSVLAATRGGLWHTCLHMSRVQYEQLVTSLSWLGPQCVQHSDKILGQDDQRMPQWFKVMNISISCCLTCLIIITVSLLLTILGMWYRQATCLTITGVMYQLATFFFLLHSAINWTHADQRVPGLSLPPSHSLPQDVDASIRQQVTFYPGWSQYLGAVGIIFSLLSSVTLYVLSRVLIVVMMNTLPQFREISV